MSEKKLEECLLEEATHIEMGSKVHELGIRPDDGYESKHQVLKYNRYHIEVYMESGDWQRIQAYAFPILGIKPLKEIKPEPIEFEAIVQQDMPFAYLSNIPEGVPLGTRFRCVEIVEDRK
jgi:hypothetical protein